MFWASKEQGLLAAALAAEQVLRSGIPFPGSLRARSFSRRTRALYIVICTGPIAAIGDERRGEGDGAVETRGEGLADPFVKLNGKENAAHVPRMKKGGGGETPNMKPKRAEKKKKKKKRVKS